MILVDTSVWIEFFRGNPKFSELGKLLEEQQIATIGCVFAELLQGARSKEEVSILTAYWDNLPRLNEESIWFEAGLLSYKDKYYAKGIGLIDLTILSAARKSKCKIWTLDKKLQNIIPPSYSFERQLD